MLRRILLVVVIVPIAIVLVALAVANRGAVPFTLDPFDPGNPALTIQLPLFVMLFLALIVGMIVGGLATWLRQGRYRKEARVQRREVQNLLRQSNRQAEATQPDRPANAALPAPGA